MKCPRPTAWQKLLSYINSFPIGTIITRTEICYATNKPTKKQNTVDQYKRFLVITGILNPVDRAHYEIANHVDETLTSKQVRKVAYSVGFESWFIQVKKCSN